MYSQQKEWSLPASEALVSAPLNDKFPRNPFNTFRFDGRRTPYTGNRAELRFAEIRLGSVVSYGHDIYVQNQDDDRLSHFSFTAKKQDNKPKKTIHIDGIALNCIANWGVKNFSQVMLSNVPRLYMETISGITPDVLLVDDVAAGFAFAAFETFAPHIKIVRIPRGTRVRADRLLTISPMHHPLHTVHPDLLAWLRQRTKAADQKRPIFIDRPVGRRNLENRSELDPILAHFDFRVIKAEEMSIQDQIDAFSNAKLVLAAHGAGLANVAYCEPGTPVIEMFQHSYGTPAFWILAGAAGCRYYPMMDSRWAPTQGDASRKFEDILIDTKELHEAIEQMLDPSFLNT